MCPKVVMTDSPLKMFFPVTNRQIQQKANPLEHHYPSGFLIYSLLFSKRKMKKIFFGESLRFNYKIFINLTLPHPCLTAGKPPFHLPLRKFIKKSGVGIFPVIIDYEERFPNRFGCLKIFKRNLAKKNKPSI